MASASVAAASCAAVAGTSASAPAPLLQWRGATVAAVAAPVVAAAGAAVAWRRVAFIACAGSLHIISFQVVQPCLLGLSVLPRRLNVSRLFFPIVFCHYAASHRVQNAPF